MPEGKRKLVQVGEYMLYGHVQSMGSVRLCNAERDSLLLAFSPAKVCGQGQLVICMHV